MNIKQLPSLLWGKFLCAIGDHDWTTKAKEGIPPDKERARANPAGYFWEYAKLYCKRPGCKETRERTF